MILYIHKYGIVGTHCKSECDLILLTHTAKGNTTYTHYKGDIPLYTHTHYKGGWQGGYETLYTHTARGV